MNIQKQDAKIKNYFTNHSSKKKKLNLLIDEQIQSLINNDSTLKVLDVGCGKSDLLEIFSANKNLNIGYSAGVDMTEQSILESKQKFPKHDYFVATSSSLPFESSAFDVVTVVNSLRFFSLPASFLSEAKRVLKNGGQLIIVEKHIKRLFSKFYNIFIRPFKHSGVIRLYQIKEMEKLLKWSAFDVVEMKKIGKIVILNCEKV